MHIHGTVSWNGSLHASEKQEETWARAPPQCLTLWIYPRQFLECIRQTRSRKMKEKKTIYVCITPATNSQLKPSFQQRIIHSRFLHARVIWLDRALRSPE